MNIDEEILQDFLVEAGELYELLGEQIVDLEQRPQDEELLNAIFRAFHTIKGGAGFLKLNEMVEVCHSAEDIFDKLRRNELNADARLIDSILQVIDVVGDMFDQVRGGETVSGAPAELLTELKAVLSGTADGGEQNAEAPAEVAVEPATPTVQETQAPVASSMDDEFDAMLQASQAQESPAPKEGKDDGLITDDEFESLLDDLHGKGQHGAVNATAQTDENKADDGLITDDEFENLLDDIHGKGQHGTVAKSAVKSEGAKPEPIVESVAAENKTDEVKAVVPEKTESKAPVQAKANVQAKAKAAQAESSVRVDTSRLDDIMNLVGELVLVRNRLGMLKQTVQEAPVVDAISNLELVTSDLQASVMKTRMQPIKKVFNRFPRVIRDLARKLKKDIDLQLIGEETDLDKNLVEALVDPMIHLVRNSIDHGIEMPEERYKNGKPRQGTITLSAVQEGDQILLTITDDGKGMDHEMLRGIAVNKGIMSEDEAARLSDVEAYNLIFAPGFSTKEEISDISGRGVGMDVVKTRISELNGTVEIDSTFGQGTVITIRLPLTLAILPTLMINLADYQFALPLTNVSEAFNMVPDEINHVDGQEVMLVRNKPLPLYYLHSWLVNDSVFEGPQTSHKVIVVQMGSQKFCLVVDHLLGQEEVVIKPLGAMLTDTPGFAGATITGDGSIALVLDMPSLIKRYASAY